jgi:exodeoxyribonuclease VII small subunit
LESGQATLDESIADYIRGTELKNYCMKKLGDARMKVEKIIQHAEGGIATEPFVTE